MKTKGIIPSFIVGVLILSLRSVGPLQAQTEPPSTEPPSVELGELQIPEIPGRIQGTGTHFEVLDSEYLNITLDSSDK